nr:cleavage/polyadenylation specificity factor, 25kDa subunit [Tanacetum cinerariifolium]
KSRIEALSDGNLRSCLSEPGGVGENREARRCSRVEAKRKIRVGNWIETKWKGSSTIEGNGYKLWGVIEWAYISDDKVILRFYMNLHASIIKDAVNDSLGVAIGTSKTHTAHRKSWWLCEDVKSKFTMKQARFRELLLCWEGNQEERFRAQERYKEAKKEAKKVIAHAKQKVYEELCKKLDSKKGVKISSGLPNPERE